MLMFVVLMGYHSCGYRFYSYRSYGLPFLWLPFLQIPFLQLPFLWVTVPMVTVPIDTVPIVTVPMGYRSYDYRSSGYRPSTFSVNKLLYTSLYMYDQHHMQVLTHNSLFYGVLKSPSSSQLATSPQETFSVRQQKGQHPQWVIGSSHLVDAVSPLHRFSCKKKKNVVKRQTSIGYWIPH